MKSYNVSGYDQILVIRRFPKPIVPRLSVAGGVIGDAFVIALIGFSLSYSLASFYAYKEGYKVDPNQVGSFSIHCYSEI